MDCLLMRHGIAVEMEEWSGLDDTRPLTEEGKKKVRQVAKGLAAMGVAPTHLFTSPLTRAQETAKLVRTILCPAVTITLCKALEPGSSPQFLSTFLRTVPDHSVVLCVGHEPLLGATAGYWLNGHASQRYPMKKAGAGLIHLPSTACAGEGFLRWWCTPTQLRVLGQAGKDKDND
jgi:phosphohistidine phosphatase